MNFFKKKKHCKHKGWYVWELIKKINKNERQVTDWNKKCTTLINKQLLSICKTNGIGVITLTKFNWLYLVVRLSLHVPITIPVIFESCFFLSFKLYYGYLKLIRILQDSQILRFFSVICFVPPKECIEDLSPIYIYSLSWRDFILKIRVSLKWYL